MLRSMLACCKLYISESRNARALECIERAVKQFPAAAVINIFKDEAYNRVGYTLVSELNTNCSVDAAPLRDAVFAVVNAAFEATDFSLHSGTHPRLGIVDHICFHPLAQATLDQVACIAKSAAADIGGKLHVPTYLYGAAHKEGRKLDSIRRELGYFKPNSPGGIWTGELDSGVLRIKPDEGPSEVHRSRGIVVIGASNWVDNYNVPVFSRDIDAVKRIAKRVSMRGGGLPLVQAMGLVHANETTEVACNLLDPGNVGADAVQAEVERLAADEGLCVGKGYFTDLSQEKIVEMYMSKINTS